MTTDHDGRPLARTAEVLRQVVSGEYRWAWWFVISFFGFLAVLSALHGARIRFGVSLVLLSAAVCAIFLRLLIPQTRGGSDIEIGELVPNAGDAMIKIRREASYTAAVRGILGLD